MALNREQFTQAAKKRYNTVHVTGLGEVRIQSLTAGEMRDIRRSLRTDAGDPALDRIARLDALVVAAAIVDDDGTRLFSDDDAMGRTFDEIDGGPWNQLVAGVKRHTGWDCGEDWSPIKAAAKN